jgi:hypothetical protein
LDIAILDQQQDGLENRHRVAGTIKTWTGNLSDFFDKKSKQCRTVIKKGKSAK